jgi:hypothetical protein
MNQRGIESLIRCFASFSARFAVSEGTLKVFNVCPRLSPFCNPSGSQTLYAWVTSPQIIGNYICGYELSELQVRVRSSRRNVSRPQCLRRSSKLFRDPSISIQFVAVRSIFQSTVTVRSLRAGPLYPIVPARPFDLSEAVFQPSLARPFDRLEAVPSPRSTPEPPPGLVAGRPPPGTAAPTTALPVKVGSGR